MINWNMVLAPDVGGMFQQGLAAGQEKARVMKANNALAAFAKNPQDSMAVNDLLQADPQMGMQAVQQQRAQAQEQALQQLTQRAASGDHGALMELAGKNPDLFKKIDGAIVDRSKRATDFMGQAAMAVSQAPEKQRAAVWQQLVRQAEAGGMDIPTQYEQYSPQALQAVIAEAGQMKQFFDLLKVDWKVRPEGAALIPVDSMGRRLDQPQGSLVPQAGPRPVQQPTQQATGGVPEDLARWVDQLPENERIPAVLAFARDSSGWNVGGPDMTEIGRSAAEAIAKGANPRDVYARIIQMAGGQR